MENESQYPEHCQLLKPTCNVAYEVPMWTFWLGTGPNFKGPTFLSHLSFFFLESLFLKDSEWVKIKYFNCSNCKEGMMLTQLG